MKSFLLVIYLFLSVFYFNVSSQVKKINFTSKESKGLVINGKKLLILWQDVKFQHKTTKLQCDSAIYERVNNSFIAYNNVEINENDSLNIYGDSVHYFGNEELAFIYGNVMVKSNKISLQTDQLTYNQKLNQISYMDGATVKDIEKGYTIESQEGIYQVSKKNVFFKENVELIHEDYTIKSDTLLYFTENKTSDIKGNAVITTENSHINCDKAWFDNINKNASFKENVIIRDEDQILQADSVFYNEIKETSYAEGNVEIIDDSSKIVIKGMYGIYDRKNDSINVWGYATFSQFSKDDTIQIYADRFLNFLDSNETIFICYNNAVIDGNFIQGDCDSIYYNKSDSLLKCINQPVIWMDNNQIKGDVVEFKAFDGQIYNMDVINEALIITKKDSIHYDQIKGDQIRGFFTNNELKSLDVDMSGKAIYYSVDEKDSSLNEINFISSESMKINIEKNNISSIKFYKIPKGKTEPFEEGAENIYLDEFKIFKKRTYQEKYLEPSEDSLKGN